MEERKEKKKFNGMFAQNRTGGKKVGRKKGGSVISEWVENNLVKGYVGRGLQGSGGLIRLRYSRRWGEGRLQERVFPFGE